MSELIPVEPFDIVVFGATGDLALRKLMPALYHRWVDGQIPERSRIIAASRDEMSDEDYRERARTHVAKEAKGKSWADFAQHLSYVSVNATETGEHWAHLKSKLSEDETKVRLYYLALPPMLYGPISEVLKAEGLCTPNARIVLEKPIGKDLESAKAINKAVCQAFPENSIFRIDHYLGKETVQNLLILRFANWMFEPIWNSTGIDHVQITVAETLGAGKRADYYDKAGALRDMVQNHLLQLLCLVAMEPPSSLDSDPVRDEKLKVLRALRKISAGDIRHNVVRAHYRAGVSAGEPVSGYEEELGRSSDTETFVAIKAHVDNWRWAGVPFYLRTGKRMASRRSEIVIQFKPVPHDIVGAGRLHPNRLVIRLQPDEGVKMMLMTKDPGPGGMRMRYVPLNLSYADTFEANYPDAYERLLLAVVRGNLSLFMRRDEVEAAWSWVDGIINSWAQDNAELYEYSAGSDGPSQSDLLIGRDEREWYDGSRY